MTAKFRWEGSVVLLRVLQHGLHARGVMGRLERLNSKQGEGGVQPNSLALRNRVISFVLQNAVFPHGDDATLVIPLNVHAVRIIGNVDGVNRVVHRNRDLDFRGFTRIR